MTSLSSLRADKVNSGFFAEVQIHVYGIAATVFRQRDLVGYSVGKAVEVVVAIGPGPEIGIPTVC